MLNQPNHKQLLKRIISENSSKACKAIGRIMFVLAIVYALVSVLFFVGIFKSTSGLAIILLVGAVLFAVIGAVSEKHSEIGYILKYCQVYLLLISVFLINIMMGYRVWLLYALPIVLSSRYYDSRFTVRTGVFAGILSVGNAFVNAYMAPYIGFIDLGTVSYSTPGTLEYHSWLFNAVIEHGYEANRVLDNSLKFSALPNCLILVLIVVGCKSYIQDAKKMLYASYEVAQKELEQIQLKYHATHDDLTGLCNRRAFQSRIDTLCGIRGSCGVIFGDLNGLKYENDNHGHEAGDKLLIRYAKILAEIFKPDEIFRISGDEFICIVFDIEEHTFNENADKLKSVLSQEEPPLASIGVTFGTSSEIEDLIKKAEAMMYEEKEAVHARFPKTRR